MEPDKLIKGEKYRVIAEQCYLKKSDIPRGLQEFRKLHFGENIVYEARVTIHGSGKDKESHYIFTSDDGFTGKLTMMLEGVVGGLWLKPIDE